MKICAIICEFNPFHNGHKYLIDQAREKSGCDFVLCIMSGPFTQRGDMAILNKFNRAKHAVLCGADVVIQLPICYSTAPAELFALGAVQILSSIPNITYLAFGCETSNLEELMTAADLLHDESFEFQSKLKDALSQGMSFIRSRQYAFSACGGNPNIISSPNNILAIEYLRALKKVNTSIQPLPIQRVGNQFHDDQLTGCISSATAIRQNLENEKLADNVPSCVFDDLPQKTFEHEFHLALKLALQNATAEQLSNIYGCTEGLEHLLMRLKNRSFSELIAGATNKRYTQSRIMRILVNNLLHLTIHKTQQYLQSSLYLKPLAIQRKNQNEILSLLSLSPYPIVIKQRDLEKCNPIAKECFFDDQFADEIYGIITGDSYYNFTLPII